MTSSKTMVSLVVLLLIWREVSADDKTCIQCATPSMNENWAQTGFPLKPSGLKFDKDCATADASAIDSSLLSPNCASSCFELMIPVEHVYNYVRGCHEQFVWDEMKVTVTNETGTCEVNQVPDYGTVTPLSSDKEQTSAYAGIAFCKPTSEETKCNKKLIDTTVSNTGVATCNSGSVHTCKSCGAYDGSGECSAGTSGTCKGVYCTKTIGKMNGHNYESRGCASFNPFAQDVCSWTDQIFNVSTGVDTAQISSRSKRGVSLSFQANQCFCQGELCNSSPASFSTLLLSTLSLIFLVST
ncbi:unnamed protein product [Caenorhabditis sp. 36 PRJEB53466]|nr:unnamed protein product [Caenorhabditis sp. 36 PRJEB53466]